MIASQRRIRLSSGWLSSDMSGTAIAMTKKMVRLAIFVPSLQFLQATERLRDQAHTIASGKIVRAESWVSRWAT
jgi:hypothetical protein